MEDTTLETSGLDDLRSALGGGSPWAPDDDTPAPEPSAEAPATSEASADTDTGDMSSQEASPNDAAAPSNEELSRVLTHPQIQAELRRRWETTMQQQLAQARQLWEAERQRQEAEEDESLLDDEEYGRRQRERAKLEPTLRQAAQTAYVRAQQEFLHLGVNSVWEAVPELKSLDANTKSQYNPTDPRFKTYGEYIASLVNLAADARAEAKAKSMVEPLVQARVQSELSNIRRSSTSPVSLSGPLGANHETVDVDKLSGKSLIELALSR